ncbi:MAG TPA: hypothetical protein VGE31_02830 [Candidatus Paceibacterota bacterium]
MNSPFITFGKVDEGSTFHGRGKIWIKLNTVLIQKGNKLNAFPVDPYTTIVDATAGTFFDDATLVRPVIEELPFKARTVVPLMKRART